MTETIDSPKPMPGKDRPGGRNDTYKKQRAAHTPTTPSDSIWNQDSLSSLPVIDPIAVAEVPTPVVQTPQLEPAKTNQPKFGEPQPQKESEKWLTLGIDTWFYDSPSWDPKRIRLGRVDKQVQVKVLQEVEGPNGRPATQVSRTYTDSEGKERTNIFWVHPKRGGFEGMPRQTVSRPTLKLQTE